MALTALLTNIVDVRCYHPMILKAQTFGVTRHGVFPDATSSSWASLPSQILLFHLDSCSDGATWTHFQDDRSVVDLELMMLMRCGSTMPDLSYL
jgi:hypothetical protein